MVVHFPVKFVLTGVGKSKPLSSPPVFGRSWVQFLSGTEISSLSNARDMLNISSYTETMLFIPDQFTNQASLVGAVRC